METHNTAVFFIVHFLHLQAVRLKDTKDSDFISDFLVMAVRRTKTKKGTGSCSLTKYSNFTSRYLRMVSFVSGMALWRYVFRSWSICTMRYEIRQEIHTTEHSRVVGLKFNQSWISNSQVWLSLAVECRISQCCGEHQQTSRKPRWLQPGALVPRWQKKHPQTLKWFRKNTQIY